MATSSYFYDSLLTTVAYNCTMDQVRLSNCQELPGADLVSTAYGYYQKTSKSGYYYASFADVVQRCPFHAKHRIYYGQRRATRHQSHCYCITANEQRRFYWTAAPERLVLVMLHIGDD